MGKKSGEGLRPLSFILLSQLVSKWVKKEVCVVIGTAEIIEKSLKHHRWPEYLEN